MKYDKIEEAVFLERPNRFIANVEIGGRKEICHVKNTGRCRELLIPGSVIYVQRCDNPSRKTKYDLIGVRKNGNIINMDSQIPNKVVYDWVLERGYFKNITLVRPETRYGGSRFDLYIEADGRRIFMEVKGVTLEEEGIARFPDAPTIRGVKHIRELQSCMTEGYEAFLFFVIQMKHVTSFEPNDRTHPQFGDACREAKKAGVHILAYDCVVSRDSITIDKEIKITL